MFVDTLSPHCMHSKGLGGPSTHQVGYIYRTHGIYRRTGKLRSIFSLSSPSLLLSFVLDNWHDFLHCLASTILQYINPIVQNSQHPLKGNLLYAIERVLKLSVPNLYVWLCMFYCFFHLWYVPYLLFSEILITLVITKNV